MVNSKRKGASGEREWASKLKDYGWEARRGQQYSGLTGQPDVISDDGLFHWEVKRVNKLNIYDAMKQAVSDAKSLIPVVAHRRDNKQWLVTLNADEFLSLIKSMQCKIP